MRLQQGQEMLEQIGILWDSGHGLTSVSACSSHLKLYQRSVFFAKTAKVQAHEFNLHCRCAVKPLPKGRGFTAILR